MIEMTKKEVFTTSPQEKKVHRIGADVYFSRCTRLQNDTADMFEEVDVKDVPQVDTSEWTDSEKAAWEEEHKQEDLLM